MRQGNLKIDLQNLYKDEPQKLKEINNYKSQIKSAEKALTESINTILMNRHELGKTITDRTDILQLVDKGKAKIKEINVPPSPTLSSPHKH